MGNNPDDNLPDYDFEASEADPRGKRPGPYGRVAAPLQSSSAAALRAPWLFALVVDSDVLEEDVEDDLEDAVEGDIDDAGDAGSEQPWEGFHESAWARGNGASLARADGAPEAPEQSNGPDPRRGKADEVVFAYGMESPVRTVVWLCGPAGEGRELGVFESAERARALFSRVVELRLVYI